MPMKIESAWTSRQLRAWTEADATGSEGSPPISRIVCNASPAPRGARHSARIADDAHAVLASIDRRTLWIYGGYAAAFVLVALTNVLDLPPLVRFGAAIIALALGAVAVGESTERLSERLSPAATGVVQSVL